MNTPVTPVGTWIGERTREVHAAAPAVAHIAVHAPSPPPPARRSSLRFAALAMAAAAGVLVMVWPSSVPLPPPAESQTWTIDVMAAGGHPIHALAYGREAGLHIITVPTRNAPTEDHRSVAARLGQGDVYLLSLGWSNLFVATSAPAGLRSGPIALTATARILRFYRIETGTFVRTSWR